eukprot:TRINITY_DN9493_c0_g1_i2.p1 TRINITY_DN9493_c0_g1~~TRINITY_DN9493_c0_g1_i2.p1  ORF type:complete len:112 (-),score=31.28 TRINITY_DN9493_c0_g1_i2:21-356(-)
MRDNVVDGLLASLNLLSIRIWDFYHELFFNCHDHLHNVQRVQAQVILEAVSYTHLRAHETPEHLVCRLLLEKKKKKKNTALKHVYKNKITQPTKKKSNTYKTNKTLKKKIK